MKITTFIIFLSFLQVAAAVNAQRINLSEKNTPVTVILNKIQQQSGFDIFYRKKLVRDSKISVQLKNASVEEALKVILEPQNLDFSIEDKLITISENKNPSTKSMPVLQREGRINGTVVDENGKPLPRASVTVLGRSNVRYTTNPDGGFVVNTVPSDTALSVSYVGYKTKIVKLESGKSNYKIALTSVDSKLNEVVVTGMFDKPKESFTGAITAISKEQIKMFGNRNLLKTIANIDPAFNIEERNNYGSDPNQLPNISIRGTSTLPTDLNNIQGTNVRNAYNVPLFILDGFEISLERVMDMNQYDVESVVILKDASSTAAYGSRGANGVVVITSIKPVAGKLRVSFSAAINMEIPDFSSYNLLNSTEKLAAEKLGGLYTASDISTQDYLNTLYNKNLKAAMEGVNTNWLKVPTQTGISQTHQLGLSGGDAEFRYTLTGSYNQITGAMKGSKRDNFNGGFSIMYLLKKVRFTNNLSVGFNNSANSPWGDFSNYTPMNPYWAPYDDDGNAVKQYSSFSSGDSPLNPAYNGSLPGFDRSKYTVVRNTTSVDWDVTKGLKWSNSVGYNRQVGSTDKYLSRSNTAFLNAAASSLGSYALSNSYAQGYQIRSNVSYGTVIDKSTIYGGVNVQATEDKQNSSSILATGFSNDTQTDLSQAINVNRPTTSESTTRTVGASATLSYIYDGRFFADANYNLTGGSSFGSDSRFGKFWSAGLGWTVSNERFMKDNLPQINTLRLRYNYGVTGNLNFAPYQSLSTYTYDRTQLYRTLTGANLTGFANKDLQWQTTYQQNAGIDMSLFDNKLSLSANYYFKRTTNAITSVYLSSSHGFATYTENLGQINNYGSDIQASFFVIKNPERKFYWSITAAASHNKNLLVKLSDALKKATEAAAGMNSTNSTFYQYVEGQSSDEVYVVQSPGVDAATGKVLYLKADGTLTTDISGVPKVAVGDGTPKINGRLSTMIRVGQFTANIGFGGRFGGKKINYTLLNKVENAILRNNIDKRVFDLRWTKPGDVTAFKSISAQDATFPNTRFVFTENTILLNNVNLNYSLPARWVKRLNMEQISISATMSDVGYWSNIEQERGTSYPYTLKPSFSVSAIF
ncbi:SusC/RagA family TonB-linked outer membrane protein [Pedobacter sp. HMWF019]|uniref:SusC/RagA family TonB-linked outer membrane protein n=1 Tax=Pedobacter sp. HMWF019 TaxID=2056856 RepID=UPI0013048EE5|nr:SusC/RagA family TonB-linked outer membrane protein [Pedobacter sp. HMWF019]